MLTFLCNLSIVLTNCFDVHGKEEEEDGGEVEKVVSGGGGKERNIKA